MDWEGNGADSVMIGICDENKNTGQELQHWVQQICQLYDNPPQIVRSERVGDLVEAMRVRHFHAILLSKDGPEGFLTVRRLREMDARVRLIFLTDTSQYAVMGVRLHLTDYVVKPVEFKNVVRAMKLAGIGNGR